VSNSTNLSQRLEFLKIDESARKAIADYRPLIEAAVPKSLKTFYTQVRRYPEVRGFFKDDAHIDHASNAQERHWQRIAGATFDSGYVESVQRIGTTHARIGLEPRWYIGGYALIIEEVVRQVVAAQFTGKKKKMSAVDGRGLAEALSAILKVAMLDIDLGVSIYLQACTEAELKKQEEAQRKQAQQVQLAVDAVARGLSYLEKGDVTYRISEDLPTEYEKLKVDFNQSVDRLQQTLKSIAAGAESITSGSAEISNAADDLSRRTEQQAASLEETAAALDEITATVKKSAEGAAEANSVVTTARKDGEASGNIVNRAVAAMGEIERSAKQINQIIGVIDEIAFQTNLLALNAGVEAARAGDAGRGFAVVASEVRTLAQRSADAAKQIKGLISESSQQVESGVELVGQAGDSLVRILDQISRINQLVSEISSSAQEQSTGLQQVNSAVNQMDQVTQQNAAMVEESTAASRSLAKESSELAALVAEFNIGERLAPRSGRSQASGGQPSPNGSTSGRRPIAQARTTSQRKALPSPPDADWQEF